MQEPQATIAKLILVRNWGIDKRAKPLRDSFPLASARQSNKTTDMTAQLAPE